MSRPQKSTIVRLQEPARRVLFRVADLAVPEPRGSHRARPLVHGPAALAATPLPTGASRSRSSRSGAVVRGPSGATGPVVYLVHGWGGRGSQLASFVEPLLAGGFRVVMFDAPAHGDSDHGPAGPGRTHGVEFGKALDAVFAEFGPAEAVIAHSLGTISTYLTLRFGWLSTRRLVLVAPMVVAEPLFDQFQRALGFGARTSAPSTVTWTSSSGSRWPSSTPSTRRRTSTRCRRSWSTTAVTGRRRGPTPSGSSSRSRTPAWSPPTASATDGILKDPAVVRQVASFLPEADAREGAA